MKKSAATKVWSLVQSGSVRQVTPLCLDHSQELEALLDDREVADMATLGEEAVLLTPERVAALDRATRRRLRLCMACSNAELWCSVIAKKKQASEVHLDRA